MVSDVYVTIAYYHISNFWTYPAGTLLATVSEPEKEGAEQSENEPESVTSLHWSSSIID